MLRASRARCTHAGLLWIFYICAVDGFIEIVEEQQCHDHRFWLTCRELDAHIAVLEAWYTAADALGSENVSQPRASPFKTESDSELDRVYVYASPKHNGVYELANTSVTDNVTSVNSSFELSFFNDTFLNDTVDMGVEFANASACAAMTFARSYGSWREGDKRRRVLDRSESINLRSPLSYRCSGVNHCSFILAEDYPQAANWLPGVVYIKYACFDDTLAVHYCNREVKVSVSGEDSEGYIRTPGYPNFYVGEDVCRWKLTAHPEQRIRVSLLDVSLRSKSMPFEPKCKDTVTVEDANGDQLVSSCEQVELPLRLTSSTHSVEVTVETRSEGAYPKRGVLLHYKSVGCVTLPAPSDGYLVYRKDEIAHYMCNVNFVFADTRQRARLIWCYDDNRWNDTVPLCVAEAVESAANGSAPARGEKPAKLPPHEQPDMIVDIVIPSLLIAALFIGNAFIVLIIYKYRKRQEVNPCDFASTPNSTSQKNEDIDDEFNTIPLSVNGNIHSAGNAV